MKQHVITAFTLALLSTSVFAQLNNANWIQVATNSVNQPILVDTANIKRSNEFVSLRIRVHLDAPEHTAFDCKKALYLTQSFDWHHVTSPLLDLFKQYCEDYIK